MGGSVLAASPRTANRTGLGKWEATTPKAGQEHVTIAVSGAHGGHTIDFRRLAAKGMILVGRTEAYQNGVISFAPDLVDNLAKGDANLLSVFDEADAYVARNGLDLPEEPNARAIVRDSDCVKILFSRLIWQGPESRRSSGRRVLLQISAG